MAITDIETAKGGQKGGPPLTHRATIRARGPPAANAMFRPTPWARCSVCWGIRPILQDRDGAQALLRQARRRVPLVERSPDQGPRIAAALARTGYWTVGIVRHGDKHRFVVLPKQGIVERTLGWISRLQTLARDFERHCHIAEAFVRMAMIRIMLCRMAPRLAT